MKYGKCKQYGFSLMGYISTLFQKKSGWYYMMTILPKEDI